MSPPQPQQSANIPPLDAVCHILQV